jgi:hypothetical protein
VKEFTSVAARGRAQRRREQAYVKLATLLALFKARIEASRRLVQTRKALAGVERTQGPRKGLGESPEPVWSDPLIEGL